MLELWRQYGRRVIWYCEWREGGRKSRVRTQRVGPSKTEARRVKVEIEARLLAGGIGGGVLPKRITFEEWSERWLGNRTNRTADRDASIIRTHLIPFFGDVYLSAIVAERVEELAAQVSRKTSPANAKRVHACFRKMLQDAERSRYIRENPAWDVRPPSPERTEKRIPSVDEASKLLGAFKEWRPFVFAKMLSGLRFGELRAVAWTDVDFKAKKISIHRQMAAHRTTLSDPKGGSMGHIDMLGPLRQMLLDLPQRTELVFPEVNTDHADFYNWWLKQVWQLAAKAAGLEGLEPHALRHFYASLLIAFGESATYVSSQLRHGSGPAFTYRQYVHLFEGKRRLPKRPRSRGYGKRFAGVTPG